MRKYIDADKAIKDYAHYGIKHFYDATDLEAILNECPAADVEEVVRCKECKWFGDIGCAIRIVDDSDRPSENDFCSFAERKDNG